MNDVRFNKILISANALVPLALCGDDAWRGNLGANPIEFFLRTTGVLTLIFLFITLSVTPLRKIFGWNNLIKFRRMLGLYAFFYGCLHLLTYFVFDRALSLSNTLTDIFQRPFVAVGMLSFFLMIPLAATSTNNMVKHLGGKNWQKLHRATYYVAFGGVIHFWLIVKSDVFYPLLFGIILVALLGFRTHFNKPKVESIKAN